MIRVFRNIFLFCFNLAVFRLVFGFGVGKNNDKFYFIFIFNNLNQKISENFGK
jgi:hypothetical protein